MAGLGFRETWTAKCLLTGKEFECGRPNDMFECRHKDRFCCPNYLRHYIRGNNCKLAVSSHKRYDRYCLPSSMAPEVERLKGKSTDELITFYNETENLFLKCEVPEIKTKYRATLGAITVILTQIGKKEVLFESYEVKNR